jgi:uncharacterized delta-60 repeat protein
MKIFTLILIAFDVLISSVSFSQPGTLDSTFSGDGKVTTPIEEGAYGWSVAIQQDGKIILAGESFGPNFHHHFALARYNTNGSLDSQFGTHGIVTTDLKPSSEHGHSVVIQPDGKIIVGGDAYIGSDLRFALARYKTDGSMDSSFGTNGLVITALQSQDHGYSVALQSDGRIVLAGHSWEEGKTETDFALARYKTDGTVDNSFGNAGLVITNVAGSEQGHSVSIQADGKILLGGYNGSIYGLARHDFVLARYHVDGNLDQTFGDSGRVATNVGWADVCYSIAIQPDGKILAAGKSQKYDQSDDDLMLTRYDTNGKLDDSFGDHGIIVMDFGETSEYLSSVTSQPDGKIVAAGAFGNNGKVSLAVVRFKPNGGMDSGFGINGRAITNFNAQVFGQDIAIQSDGKIVVAGASPPELAFALARYNNDEALPVSLINLKGYPVGSGVKLEWTALNELNISQYKVERSVDGKNFITIGNVNALDNGQQEMDYSFIDNTPTAGDNFYRIKSVSNDGIGKYTDIVKVNFANSIAAIFLSPNPVKDILHIQGLSTLSKTISLLDLEGRLLQQITTSNSNYSLNVKPLSAGVYFVRIAEGDKTTKLRFIKE